MFIAMAPAGVPRVENVGVNLAVVSFSLIAITLTGIAASLVPAWRASQSDFSAITKDGGRSTTAGRARTTARNFGIAAQIAFTLPLLVGATLLIRSAVNVARVDLGFRRDGIVTLAFEVSRTRHPGDRDVADYYARLIDGVRSLPGVMSAGLVNRIPLVGGQTNGVHFETSTSAINARGLTEVDSRSVTPDYFSTLAIKLIAGRGFTDRDDADAPRAAIVDERIARAMWPGEEAVGKRFREPSWRGGQVGTVIGVVAHVRTTGVEVDPMPQVYWSYRQWTQDRMVLAVRSTLPSAALIAPIIRVIRSIDREQSVFDVRTMTDIVGRSLMQRRLTMLLMAGFSGLALLLAAVGIYGTVAYGVTQRVREFGIRVALGATSRQITRLVLWQGTSLAIAGAAVGLVVAIAAAGGVSHLVYGVEPRDVLSMVAAMALLILVAGAASYIPARRAAAVDPGVTLRAE
jgi:predicted permease